MADRTALLRRLPSVDELVRRLQDAGFGEPSRTPRGWVADAARAALDDVRAEINRLGQPDESIIDMASLVGRATHRLRDRLRPRLPRVINGTGILVHTGLGRSPLAERAVDAIEIAARSYVPVELDMTTGERGRRAHVVRDLLCEATGAESATVVNNNAAALMITLAALARDRSVLVARGELIEIGGSFRLPEVMRAGGAILREVGTTNRTRLRDYADAIGPSTAAILKVHTSNYRVEGFTAEASLSELAQLAKSRDLVLIDDIGSGLLRPLDHSALRGEPNAKRSLEQGADLILFSGDKLLGGPQAGIILGKRGLIERIERHPMMRAVRVDKITLAGLATTLVLHADESVARNELPIMRMLHAAVDDLRIRAQRMVDELAHTPGLSVEVCESSAYVGGGSVPTQAIGSIALRVVHQSMSEEMLAEVLRLADPPVLCRRQEGAIWCDLRTVQPEEDELLLASLRRVGAEEENRRGARG